MKLEIKLLADGYKKSERLYQDFLEDRVLENEEHFSGETVQLKEAPDFPIYIAKGSEAEKKRQFLEAFQVISESYLQTERDIHFNGVFWHSLLVTAKRDYIIEHYPQVTEGIKHFHNIVLKNFDWENYIYKCVIGAQYINDNVKDEKARKRYYELIVENLDVYNYIIKYEIFRNDRFLINILDIIDELDLSKVMKAKIKGRDDLGSDPRVGRFVLYEFNKSYPVIMSPMMEKEELKDIFLKYLGYYWKIEDEKVPVL